MIPLPKNDTYSKSYLREVYHLSESKLKHLLNVLFYEELKAVGYKKYSSILSPAVVEKFVELWGLPEEFKDEK